MRFLFNPFTNNLDIADIGGGTPNVETLTGNTGGAVPADGSGNINVVGDGTTITFSGNPGTNTLTASVAQAGIVYYSLTPYIVGSDVHSQYSTIGAAITAFNLAGVPGNIYIKPGTYTEDVTLPANCNLVGFENGRSLSTILKGKITATYSGRSSISGLQLQTNSDFSVVVSGSNATILAIHDCYFNCLNNTGISYTNSSASSSISIVDCNADLGNSGVTLFVSTSSGILSFRSSILSNTIQSSVPSSSSAGTVFLIDTLTTIPFSSSGTASYRILGSSVDSSITNTPSFVLTGSSNNFFHTSELNSGNVATITIGAGVTAQIINSIINSSNTNAITGTGTLNYTDLQFPTSAGISVTNNSLAVSVNGNSQLTGYQVINAVSVNNGASPYVALSTDYYISVNTSGGAVTVRLPNAPTTNRIFVIKDSTGTAAASNISVTTPGGAVTFDGSTTYTMNVNYQAINVRFNGSNYEVF